MSRDEFTKLFQYMSTINEKIDNQTENMATKKDIDSIMQGIDAIEKQLEIHEDERLVFGYQLERLQKWVQEMAAKIDYTLPI